MALEFPPIYLLKCGFEKIPHELYKLETQIGVVWDIREADIVLGRLQTKTKANHELRKLGLHTEEVNNVVQEHKDPRRHIGYQSSNKRKVDEAELDGNETISLSETELSGPTEPKASSSLSTGPSIVRTRLPMGENGGDASTIKVLKCAWYVDSLKAGKLLPQDKYLVFEGRIINPAIQARVPTLPQSNPLSEARADPSLLSNEKLFSQHGIHGPRAHPTQTSKQPATLIHETTEDNDNLPPIPKYLHTRFCCERPTPLHCPNETFLSQLRIIKKGRLLRGDEIGVRAYSAAIATVASYPHIVTSPFEIKRLPNCGDKIATVWQQWRDTGHAQEAEIYEADEKFQVMSLFYNIHDVGYKRALKFWDNGWRNLDDIVEQGWDTLSRNQQIGIKYYYEFSQRIPRIEVERISNKVLQYANRIQLGFQMVICGGYRRGNVDSGDVDIVLSHPDEDVTEHLLTRLLEILEEDGYITHRLEHAMTNSERGQNTLEWKGFSPKRRGGFDTLDHAFVVWQEPSWPAKKEDLKSNPNASNPNIHRRVDIIISPWKTAGCAVLGWSGGTMFERDLRAYSRQTRGWKFDSSGVRVLNTGEWVDLEGCAKDMWTKEKKVFEGLQLEWREPTERCTD